MDKKSTLRSRQPKNADPDDEYLVIETFDGGKVEANIARDSVYIRFDDVPPADVRFELKSKRFRWIKNMQAWGRRDMDDSAYGDIQGILAKYAAERERQTEKMTAAVKNNSRPRQKLDPDKLEQEMREKVKKTISAYREDPDRLIDYLDFASHFKQYSHKNCRLIYSQNSHACFVAPASAYIKGLPGDDGIPISDEPIYPKRGEKALRIWKPVEKTFVRHADSRRYMPLASLSQLDRKRAAAEKWDTLHHTDYILVPVFDITQTTMPSELYPRFFGFGDGDRNANIIFDAMKAYAENELNCPVNITDLKARKLETRGYFLPESNEIYISDLLRGEERLSTLLHEIGHATLHGAAERTVLREESDRIELEADMYAIMLQSKFGVLSTDSRAEHISRSYDAFISRMTDKKLTQDEIDAAEDRVFSEVFGRFYKETETLDRYVANYTEYAREELKKQAAAAELARAEKLIRDFLASEFGENAGRFDDLSRIELAYTTIGDTDLPIQATVDLVHFRLRKELGGELTETVEYESLADINDKLLSDLDFSVLTHVSDEQVREYLARHGSVDRPAEPPINPKDNIACRDAVEAAIAGNYRDYKFDAQGAVLAVLKDFSPEQLAYITAYTVCAKAHDGRIDRDIKEWAKSICGDCLESEPIIDSVSPGLVNMFAAELSRHLELLRAPAPTAAPAEAASKPLAEGIPVKRQSHGFGTV